MTFEEKLDRMISKVPSNIDTRKGSLLYLALAPVSHELTLAEIEAKSNLDKISLDKATGEYLTELCAQNGTFRKSATYAHRKGIFNREVPLGSRFGLNETTYSVVSHMTGYEYILECEQIGEVGNIYSGSLLSISYIEGLTTATLGGIISAAVDIETDEQLRERHRQNIINPPQDGNVAQYLKWATDHEEVGRAKVFPLWNGGNTVKVAITDRSFLPASPALVDQFQNYMDPGSTGLGNGKAPIGSKVTIVGGTQKDVNITANVVLAEGYLEAEGVAAAITDFLASMTYLKNSVSYIRLGSAILDCPSIADVSDLTLNGELNDLSLIGDEIPVLNNFNLVVVSP